MRRRRAREARHRSSRQWTTAARARRRAVRTFALCAGALLLMVIGLYFVLARQETAAPDEGAARGRLLGARGIG